MEIMYNGVFAYGKWIILTNKITLARIFTYT